MNCDLIDERMITCHGQEKIDQGKVDVRLVAQRDDLDRIGNDNEC